MFPLFLIHAAIAAPSPPGEPSAIGYAADLVSNRCTSRPLYYVRGGFVFAADVRGQKTDKILSYIVGDKVYAADDVTGAQRHTVVRCISGNAITD
jgi:hypothetical protein